MLRLREMRLPEQQQRLEQVLGIPGIRTCKLDMTGLGLGLFEYTQQKFPNIVHGLNFSSTVQISSISSPSPRWGEGRGEVRGSVRLTEYLATQLLQVFEDRAIQIPIDIHLRDDLRKPERLVSSSGRVSIAATRDEAGHADHFWSLALAINAAQSPAQKPFAYYSWLPKSRRRIARI